VGHAGLVIEVEVEVERRWCRAGGMHIRDGAHGPAACVEGKCGANVCNAQAASHPHAGGPWSLRLLDCVYLCRLDASLLWALVCGKRALAYNYIVPTSTTSAKGSSFGERAPWKRCSQLLYWLLISIRRYLEAMHTTVLYAVLPEQRTIHHHSQDQA
jgi:hypothetical protein